MNSVISTNIIDNLDQFGENGVSVELNVEKDGKQYSLCFQHDAGESFLYAEGSDDVLASEDDEGEEIPAVFSQEEIAELEQQANSVIRAFLRKNKSRVKQQKYNENREEIEKNYQDLLPRVRDYLQEQLPAGFSQKLVKEVARYAAENDEPIPRAFLAVY